MMMPVIEILERTIGSCDFSHLDFEVHTDWEEVIRVKSSDSGFGRLVGSYLENGWDEDSTIGWEDGYIQEGHHRLVLAILLCLDEVPVSDYGSGRDDGISAHHRSRESYVDFLCDNPMF